MNWKFPVKDDFVSVQGDEAVSKVLRKLKKDKEVIVFKKKKYLGVVTKRNIVRVGMNFPEEKVSNLVFKPPKIYKDTDTLTIAKSFVETGVHYLPVLDLKDKNKVISVIHRIDFLKDEVGNYLKRVQVGDITSRDIKTIQKTDNLAKALALFQEFNISKLIVYSDKLEGVITLSNVISKFMHSSYVSKSALQKLLVKDVMKENVITIKKDALISSAINLFLKKNISSIVVLDGSSVFGLITKTDVLEKYIYLKEQEYKRSSVQISAKFSGLNKADLEKKFMKLEKFSNGKTKTFVYYRLGKDKFRGLPLVNCRVRVVEPRHIFIARAEGWGFEQATELAIKKLKRKMGEVSF